MLTSRERVLCALNHEEPDRVPVFFGTSGVTSMLSPAYERLKSHFGIERPARYISRVFQYARIDEEVMQRFGSDGRPLLAGPAPSSLRREISQDLFADEWGIVWERRPDTLYFEVKEAPLKRATVDDLAEYPWPALADPGRFAGLAEEARALREQTNCAVVALSGVSPFEFIQLLRGSEQFLTDLAADRDFANALLRKITDLMLASVTQLVTAAGDFIDVIVMGDDMGTQSSLIMSPRMYRTMIKPLHAELIAAVKKRSKAKIFWHTDGNVYPLIGDFIEIGVDLLNPIQVSAGEMGNTERLKREFGKNLAFSGAIDTNWVLPNGSPEDVRREVRRRIKDLAPGGGYVLSSVHCIQPDVPVENVEAMFDEAHRAGQYPITG